MKQKNITPEVIKLSKEIAEIWRMDIYKGCWIKIKGKIHLITAVLGNYNFTIDCQWQKGRGLPIPSISDCESKLKELGFVSLQILINSEIKPTCVIWGRKTDTYGTLGKAKTSHLALLSALLEVLKK